MEQYIIKGGNPLVGEVEIGGAKNAALAILAAAIMTDETVQIDNLPDVNDVNVMLEAIEGIGAMVQRIDRHTVKINGSTMKSDYVQVNHHGYNGSVVYFQTIAPRVALLPNGGYKKSTGWGALLGSTANRWLARKVDQTVFAGDGITTVELKVG